METFFTSLMSVVLLRLSHAEEEQESSEFKLSNTRKQRPRVQSVAVSQYAVEVLAIARSGDPYFRVKKCPSFILILIKKAGKSKKKKEGQANYSNLLFTFLLIVYTGRPDCSFFLNYLRGNAALSKAPFFP